MLSRRSMIAGVAALPALVARPASTSPADLLADAEIIYRVQTAPSRQVYHIDLNHLTEEKAVARFEEVRRAILAERDGYQPIAVTGGTLVRL